jgi:hypothetical protein
LRRSFPAFTAVTAIGAASPLLALPAVSSSFGQPGWRLYAICLSVGSVGAVLTTGGYTLSGPVTVAALDRRATPRVLSVALRIQALIWVILLPITSTASLLLTDSRSVGTAILLTQSAVAAGLSVSWFFIGRSQPLMCLLFDTGPRALGAVLGAGALFVGGPLAALPAIQLFFALAGVSFAIRHVRSGAEGDQPVTMADMKRAWRRQQHFLAAQASSMVYINAPTSLLAITAPVAVAPFAAVDRLMRLGLTGLLPLTQGLQGWFPSRAESDRRAVRRVIAAHGWLGLIAGGCLAVALPAGVAVLLQGTVQVSTSSAALAGVIVFLVLQNRALGSVVLAHFDRGRYVMWSAVAGSVTALIAVPWLGTRGPSGALAAVALAETVVLTGQALSLSTVPRARQEAASA